MTAVVSFGQPGVEFSGQHEEDVSVLQIFFLSEQVSVNYFSLCLLFDCINPTMNNNRHAISFKKIVIMVGDLVVVRLRFRYYYSI